MSANAILKPCLKKSNPPAPTPAPKSSECFHPFWRARWRAAT